MKIKTPEEYLKEHVVLPEEGEREGKFSTYELDFIKKYLGEENIPPSISIEGEKLGKGAAPTPPEKDLRALSEVQFVGFAIGNQEIAIPIHEVQEVIKKVPYTQLPSSPSFVVGVINLRNRIVPLVDISGMLGAEISDIDKYRFVVVCNFHDFRVGIMVERITTMHKVFQNDIEWNIEMHIGSSDVIMGLIKVREKLISIVDLTKLVNTILR